MAVAALSAPARLSAARSARATAMKSEARRQRTASASAINSQIAPQVPMRVSQTKTWSSGCHRWWTTQRSQCRSKEVSSCPGSDGDDLLRLVDQVLQVERLADECLRAARRCLRLRLLVRLAAEHHDGDHARAVLLLYAAQHLPAVDVRHHHVEEDEVGLRLLDRCEAFVRTSGFAYEVTLELEIDAHELAHLLVVVDEQDERTGLRLTARTGSVEEDLEVGPAVPAVSSRCVEGGHLALVGPLSNGALGHAEEPGRLSQGEPFAVVSVRHPWEY